MFHFSASRRLLFGDASIDRSLDFKTDKLWRVFIPELVAISVGNLPHFSALFDAFFVFFDAFAASFGEVFVDFSADLLRESVSS